MRLTLRAVSEIAADVVKRENPKLEVIGVTPGEGGGEYAEVVMAVNGCRAKPCTISLGILRDLPEPELRSAIASKLRDHLASPH
jgi:hypothetical protein